MEIDRCAIIDQLIRVFMNAARHHKSKRAHHTATHLDLVGKVVGYASVLRLHAAERVRFVRKTNIFFVGGK